METKIYGMEVGKYYQNKKTKTVIQIVGESKQTYVDGTHLMYDVQIPYCDANASNKEVYGKFQLPYFVATNGDWSEVVIDSDGLVYQLVD